MELIEGEFASAAQSVRRTQVLGHLGVSRASFYRRRATGDEPSRRQAKRARNDPPQLVARIKQIVTDRYTRVYGYRKVQAVLEREGFGVSQKLVRNLMRYHGWQQPRRRKSGGGFDPALLLRPTDINQVWQMDITQLWVENAGWRFVINVVDYHSR